MHLLGTKQWIDPFFFAMINLLDIRNESLVFDLAKYIQRYISSGRFVSNENEILCYRHRQKGGKKTIMQMLPSSLINSVLEKTHGKMHHSANRMSHEFNRKMKHWRPKTRQDMNYPVSVASLANT